MYVPLIQVSLVQGQILLSGYEADMWSEGHEQHTINFIENPKQRVLLAFIDPRNGLVVTPNLPSFEIEELAYFVKNEESIVTAENFDFIVQCGTVKSTYIDSLLRLLKDHFGPTFFTNQSWPDGIRNNFSGQLHRTMAHLTDAQHRTVGHTVLYIPDEGPAMHSPDAAKNKELVQRLEGKVMSSLCSYSVIHFYVRTHMICINDTVVYVLYGITLLCMVHVAGGGPYSLIHYCMGSLVLAMVTCLRMYVRMCQCISTECTHFLFVHFVYYMAAAADATYWLHSSCIGLHSCMSSSLHKMTAK